ncbi:IclR family transcriptional regulator [Geodermatophilus sp. DSM 44513]|uniref:IclR family transcriptional regulator n=1 Tax=Geodermatophilus sp. DSM 44513 TaxID=1528104 RepID=UPI0028F6F088|nr:IclR family transcriptional regulator [Geodermatophilus sp. DSM 44513]WNV75827.1 IclR family transcriptional regulator [Geodermatophilus sp. DSM 44513]
MTARYELCHSPHQSKYSKEVRETRMHNTGVSQSVERAFELLEHVAAAGPAGISLADLAATVPTAKSTTHRYAATLLQIGVLERAPMGRLRLGLGLVTLASSYLADHDVRAAAEPALRQLVELTNETVHLGVPSGSDIVYIAKVESPQSVRLVSRVGARVAMHCSAMGKTVLAHLSPQRRAELLTEPLPLRTERTLVGDALLEELQRVRAQGFAIDDEENELGVRCLGVPILDADGEPVAAVSISAPASRMSHEKYCAIAAQVRSIVAGIPLTGGLAPTPVHHLADRPVGARLRPAAAVSTAAAVTDEE